MSQVQGNCPTKFLGVKKLLENLIASREELGASIVVNHAGEDVLDIWGGYKDPERTTPWEKDTITTLWSSTKIATSMALLMLVDQGKIDISAPVSKYWPEFGVNGKEKIQVRHILSHTSGVSGWDQPVSAEVIYDIPSATEKLAKQAPWWEPGTASGYHALNYGHLLGELIRRVSGRSLKEFITSEIAEPTNADFQIGALRKDWPRISNIVRSPPMSVDFSTLPQDSPMVKTFTGPLLDPAKSWEPAWRNTEMGATNGHGNVRSLNRVARVITLGGTANGKQLLSPETIDLILSEQSNGTDLVMGHQVRFGTGYGLRADGPPTSVLPKGRVCFWAGWGGSIAIMDLDRKITLTYVMNKMGEGTLGSTRTWAYVHKVYEALGDDTVGTPWNSTA